MPGVLCYARGVSARNLIKGCASFLVLAVVGCGSNPSKTAEAPERTQTPARTRDLLAAVTPADNTVARLRPRAMLSGRLYQSLFKFAAGLPVLGKELSRIEGACGSEWATRIDELVVVPEPGDGGTGLVLARVSDAAWGEQCLRKVFPDASPSKAGSGAELVLAGDRRAIHTGSGVWVFGAAEPARAAAHRLDQPTARHAVSQQLAALPHEPVLFVWAKPGRADLQEVTVASIQDGARSELTVRVRAGSEAAAQQFADTIRDIMNRSLQATEEQAGPEQKQMLQDLFERTLIEVRGAELDVAIKLPDERAQEFFAGMLASLAVRGVQRYLEQARSGEQPSAP